MSEPRLSARGITIGYPPAAPLIADLSISLRRGETLAILGPNGRGKSSLLRVLAGLHTPISGQVGLNGQVAWLPQSLSPAFAFTAKLIAVMGRMAQRGPFSQPGPEDWVAAQAALDRMGIGQLANRSVTALSGGERQMVWLARAIAADADLLLLDEPTAPLDLRNQSHLLALLRHLSLESGTSIVFTTHDPDHARLAAQRVLMLFGDGAYLEAPTDEALTAENLRRLYRIGFRKAVAEDGETVLIPDYRAA